MELQTRFRPDLVHHTAYLAPGSVVLGDVTIGEESSIWFNAVVRGDTTAIRIGKQTNIQDGAILHADPGYPCVIEDQVTVGHAAIVHGATVGARTVVGMRAVILNGAKIGENCIIGSGAVITAGTVVPAGSMVLGVPARVHRPLKPEEIERNRQTAEHYVMAARQYKQGESESRTPAPAGP